MAMLSTIVVTGCQISRREKLEARAKPEKIEAVFSAIEEHDELDRMERMAWRQARKNYLKSLYQERVDPYFGLSDQGASCEARSVKQIDESTEGDATYITYQILTTDSGATGVCDEKMQTHQMTLVFAACANRPLQFTIKLICPLTSRDPADSCFVSRNQITNYCLFRSL